MTNKLTYIAAFSGGKDSTAMVLLLLERGYPLDEVMFVDMGKEYPCIYHNVDQMEQILKAHNIPLVRLSPPHSFDYYAYEKPTRTSKFRTGWGWCGMKQRWGTRLKIDLIRAHCKQLGTSVIHYIGIATDERERYKVSPNGGEQYPLIGWGLTEADALVYCYRHGFHWLVNGIEIYDYLTRVSCYCCTNCALNELRFMYFNVPDYFEKLREMERRILNRPKATPDAPDTLYKHKGLQHFADRFEHEKATGRVVKDRFGVWVLSDTAGAEQGEQ